MTFADETDAIELPTRTACADHLRHFRADEGDIVERFRQTGEKPVRFPWAHSVKVIRPPPHAKVRSLTPHLEQLQKPRAKGWQNYVGDERGDVRLALDWKMYRRVVELRRTMRQQVGDNGMTM
jgi:hypothetical protein